MALQELVKQYVRESITNSDAIDIVGRFMVFFRRETTDSAWLKTVTGKNVKLADRILDETDQEQIPAVLESAVQENDTYRSGLLMGALFYESNVEDVPGSEEFRQGVDDGHIYGLKGNAPGYALGLKGMMALVTGKVLLGNNLGKMTQREYFD